MILDSKPVNNSEQKLTPYRITMYFKDFDKNSGTFCLNKKLKIPFDRNEPKFFKTVKATSVNILMTLVLRFLIPQPSKSLSS